MAIDREYAKYELQHALLDGVFAPTRKVKDGELRLRKIEAYYDYPDPKTGVLHKRAIYLKLLVPYSLNPQAESILLAIIKQSGLHGIRNKELHIEPTQPTLPFRFDTGNTAIAAFLFDIEDGGSAREKPVAIAVISPYQLLRDAGMSDSKDSEYPGKLPEQRYRLVRHRLPYRVHGERRRQIDNPAQLAAYGRDLRRLPLCGNRPEGTPHAKERRKQNLTPLAFRPSLGG